MPCLWEKVNTDELLLCLHAVSCKKVSCHVHAPFCTYVYSSEAEERCWAANDRDSCDIIILNTLEVFGSPLLRSQVLWE